MREALSSATPSLADVVNTLVDAALIQMNISVPAKVVTYYPDKQYADVQIQLKQRYEADEDASEIPVIPNVPVVFPRANGGKVRMHWPLKKGDDLQLVFAHRSLDNWKTQGGMTDPNDRRKFNRTDAVAYVGGSAIPDAFEVNDPESLEIVNDQTVIQLKPDGTLNLGGFAPTKSVALGEAVEARLSAIESKVVELATDAATHVHNIITPAPGSPTGVPIPPATAFTPDTSVVSSSKAKVVP